MNIAYIATLNLAIYDGVAQKINSQIVSWNKLGNKAQLFCNVPNSSTKVVDLDFDITIYKEKFSGARIFSKGDKIVKDIERFKPDVIYMRAEVFCPYIIRLAKIAPLVIELNTDDIKEYMGEAKRSFRKTIRLFYHLMTRNIYLGKAKGFVAVTNEIDQLRSIKKFKKPSIAIPNSVDLEAYSEQKKRVKNKKPEMVFIANRMCVWHGIDKIIKLSEILKNKVKIHVIGENENYIDVKNNNLIFHGFLGPLSYRKIFRSCDIGIGTLALHRKGMNEASPLKTREYIASGLPVVIGYEDTAFIGEKKPEWILQIPNTENNVIKNYDKIYKFSLKMMGKRISRKSTEKYIDTKYLENKRLKFFQIISSY